jgi:DNA-binding response OmpR family regulator
MGRIPRLSYNKRRPSKGGTAVAERGRILIVDHDESGRSLMAKTLARVGYATVEADTGEAALAAVRAERPALVLLDVSLPDINGFEVCRELRDDFGDELPIIFVSGDRTDSIDCAVGLLVGGDDYLVKPFDPDELVARTRRAVVRSQPETPSAGIAADLGLTRREVEVLEALAKGLRPAEIAATLVISPKTVASHVQRILGKLGVHTRAHAVARAYQRGLLKPTEAQQDGPPGHGPGLTTPGS